MRQLGDGRTSESNAARAVAVRFPKRRLSNGVGFAACGLLIAYAYYSQVFLDLDPCPLCVFQRVGVVVMGFIFLVAALHHPRAAGARAYGVLIALVAIAGAVVSGRHVWLQGLPPDQIPACGPGLEYIFDVFSLGDALQMVFTGSGECADISWRLLGLSMPSWVLASFVILGVIGLVQNWSD